MAPELLQRCESWNRQMLPKRRKVFLSFYLSCSAVHVPSSSLSFSPPFFLYCTVDLFIKKKNLRLVTMDRAEGSAAFFCFATVWLWRIHLMKDCFQIAFQITDWLQRWDFGSSFQTLSDGKIPGSGEIFCQSGKLWEGGREGGVLLFHVQSVIMFLRMWTQKKRDKDLMMRQSRNQFCCGVRALQCEWINDMVYEQRLASFNICIEKDVRCYKSFNLIWSPFFKIPKLLSAGHQRVCV